ncbi:hypothetical protein SSAG_06713 [Streptomyces sp. Mg1]|nr:hypothetical protein SSAG_06713 [Streptomyces sp. Mg1]
MTTLPQPFGWHLEHSSPRVHPGDGVDSLVMPESDAFTAERVNVGP